jgi:hypothetical protein
MKVLTVWLGALSFFAGSSSALGDAVCKKCTYDMEMQYKNCVRSGRDRAACSKEQQAAALACVAICNRSPKPDPNTK